MVKFKADVKSVKTKYDKDMNQFVSLTIESDIETVDNLEELLRMTGFSCAISMTQQERQPELFEEKD
jgi:PHP family Zn ribbon phosphoesterase